MTSDLPAATQNDLRTAWLTGRADLRERFLSSGLIESGGCPCQFAAAVTGELLAAGEYEGHVAALRVTYRARRDALVDALRAPA